MKKSLNRFSDKISCIVPTYNRHELLCNCIQYYLDQTYDNKELIIVDDSTKRISDLNKRYITNLKRDDILYVNCPRTTIGNKRNQAIKISTGTIICFWDDDDIHKPLRLQRQLSQMLKTRCDISFLKNVPCLINDEIVHIPRKLHDNWWWKGYICPTMMFRRRLWGLCKFRNTNISEDSGFVKGLTNNIKIDVWNTTQILFVYNVHSNGVSNFYKYIETH